MNKRILTISAALTTIAGLAVSAPVFAAPDTDELPAELRQNLDLNGDGIIGPQEQARAERLRARVDWDRDGTIGEQERTRAQQAFEAYGRDDDPLMTQQRQRDQNRLNQLDVNNESGLGRYEHQYRHELRDNANNGAAGGNQRR